MHVRGGNATVGCISNVAEVVKLSTTVEATTAVG